MGQKSEKNSIFSKLMNFGPHIVTLDTCSGRATRFQNFVGHSSKTAEIWRWKQKQEKPIFLKVMNFGPHILTLFLKSVVQGYTKPKFCRPKLKNGGDIAMGVKNQKTLTFSKIDELWSTYYETFEKPSGRAT